VLDVQVIDFALFALFVANKIINFLRFELAMMTERYLKMCEIQKICLSEKIDN